MCALLASLPQEKPQLVQGWQLPAAEQAAGGTSHEAASQQQWQLAFTVQELDALLSVLQPAEVAGAARDAAAKVGKAAPADAARFILGSLGLSRKRKQASSSSDGSNGGSSATGSGGDSGGSNGSLPYVTPNIIDRKVDGGIAHTCELLKHMLCSSVTPKGARGQEVAALGNRQVAKLLAHAQRHAEGGKLADAAAHKFLAQALAVRFSQHAGQPLPHSLIKAGLLLIGGQGTGTHGHLDPAAALTVAYALLPSDQQCQQEAVLAAWLFVSPVVFTRLPLLLKLLALQQLLLSERDVAAAAQQAASAEDDKTRAGPAARRAAQQAQAAAAAKRAYHQQQYAALVQQQQQQPGGAAATESLSSDEQASLQVLLQGYKLTPAEMGMIEKEMGKEYAVVLEQRAGVGVSVPVGWLHWVVNVRPCIKVAWELARPQHIAGAVQMHRHVRCKMAGLPLDYMALAATAVKELL